MCFLFCKGTTKNAHTQVERAFFGKIIDSLSIEAVYLLLVGSSIPPRYHSEVTERIQKGYESHSNIIVNIVKV